MKRTLLTLKLVVLAGVVSVNAQNMYPINNSWLDLETLVKTDSIPQNVDSVNFKTASKFAARFNVVNLTGTVPTETVYKGRPFKIADEGHMSYRIPPYGKDVLIETNKEETPLDDVPGNDFIFPVSDGVVHIQRFEGNVGYRVTRVDEWCKVKCRQNIPHTLFTPVKDKDDFKTPYLFYFTHTDRYVAFTSLNAKSIHKTVIVDLKDGKAQPIEATICGVIRSDNEIAFKGYLVRDEAAKTVKVSMQGSNWALRDNNVAKLVAEAVVNDTTLILARYHQSGPGISLVAFSAKTGKPVWNGEVQQATGIPGNVYLSIYKNRLMMEVAQPGGKYLEVFDLNTGKRVYSTI